MQPLVDQGRETHAQRAVCRRDGKTHRAYLWTYATGAFEATRAVVYDFCESRAGEIARVFLGAGKGRLVCDDFSGYKALMATGVPEVGCLAHARRKFFDLGSPRFQCNKWPHSPRVRS